MESGLGRELLEALSTVDGLDFCTCRLCGCGVIFHFMPNDTGHDVCIDRTKSEEYLKVEKPSLRATAAEMTSENIQWHAQPQ